MRIGIDAHVLGKNLGGVERFIAELIKQLPAETPAHEYIIFVTKKAYATLQSQSNRKVQYVPLAFSKPFIERLILLPWLVKKYQLDALMVQRLAPWFCGRCKLIVTIHDLTPIKFASAYKGLSNQLVRLLTRNSAQRAALILTPTKAIKSEIETYYPEVKAPIHHFYNGVDTSAFRNRTESSAQNAASAPYLLTVGAIERRKNLETIIAMLALLKDQTIQLYILGGIRDQLYFAELNQQIATLNLKERVHYLGFMDEKALIARYQHAAIFITASKDEGFNIPPLESMACGVPVLCSDIPVHQELFTDAALFFKADSATSLLAKVELALNQPEITQPLIQHGYAKVAQFNWQQTALNVANAFKELV
jgi:glycosyltransferase involved in cell wall biosynthesis